MIAVDTNVLVYSHRREAAEHKTAAGLLRSLAEGTAPWAIPWPCVYEFFSAVTNSRIWGASASTPDQAWTQLSAWLESPAIRLIGESEGFATVLEGFARRSRVRGPIIHDALVAAICVAHAVEKLYTRDRDFSLFPELPTQNPFV